MDNNKSYLVLYHKEDNDGVFSAAIFLDFLLSDLKIPKSRIQMVGCDHNTINKMTEDEIKGWTTNIGHVAILDISFGDWKKMKLLYTLFKQNITWVDHHAPIIKESIVHEFDGINGIRDTNFSTIVNLYNYLYNPLLDPQIKIPKFLNYLSLWDSWTYKPEDTELIRCFNTAVTVNYMLDIDEVLPLVHKMHLNPMDHIHHDDIDWDVAIQNQVIAGEYILKADDFRWKQLLENYSEEWTVGPDNRKALAVYVQGPSSSLNFKSVSDKYENGIVFKHNPDNTWSFSLYNTKNDSTFHCGTYLREEYKGGGHEGAAGAQITNRKWNSLYKTKHL